MPETRVLACSSFDLAGSSERIKASPILADCSHGLIRPAREADDLATRRAQYGCQLPRAVPVSPIPPRANDGRAQLRLLMFSRFGNLLKLRNLSLAGNRLETIPPSFGNLLHLDRVVLDCNSLRRLPETLGRMKCHWLNVSNNKLVRKLWELFFLFVDDTVFRRHCRPCCCFLPTFAVRMIILPQKRLFWLVLFVCRGSYMHEPPETGGSPTLPKRYAAAD